MKPEMHIKYVIFSYSTEKENDCLYEIEEININLSVPGPAFYLGNL